MLLLVLLLYYTATAAVFMNRPQVALLSDRVSSLETKQQLAIFASAAATTARNNTVLSALLLLLLLHSAEVLKRCFLLPLLLLSSLHAVKTLSIRRCCHAFIRTASCELFQCVLLYCCIAASRYCWTCMLRVLLFDASIASEACDSCLSKHLVRCSTLR